MVINGVEFEFDITDQEDVGRMEKALADMEKAETKLESYNKQGNASKFFEMANKMIADFFLETTGTDVLKGVTSFIKSKEFYFEFLGEVEKQKDEILSDFSLNRVR